MEIFILRSFLNDIKKLTDKKLKHKVKDFVIETENAESLEELVEIKKMKGFATAYRCRVGDYRLGFYKNENTIELARFVKRSDIYKIFP